MYIKNKIIKIFVIIFSSLNFSFSYAGSVNKVEFQNEMLDNSKICIDKVVYYKNKLKKGYKNFFEKNGGEAARDIEKACNKSLDNQLSYMGKAMNSENYISSYKEIGVKLTNITEKGTKIGDFCADFWRNNKYDEESFKSNLNDILRICDDFINESNNIYKKSKKELSKI